MKKLLPILILALVALVAIPAKAAKPKVKTETVTYVVNMHCQNCVDKLTDNLSFLKGVEDCKISLAEKTITIKFDPSKVKEQTFVDAIKKLGYTATKQEAAPAKKGKR